MHTLVTAQFDKLNEVLKLLFRVFGIRITLFDVQARELAGLEVKRDSDYCRTRRRSAAFERQCRACDSRHLELARVRRDVLTYRCHHGLLEGIVPLYDRDGIFLGAIMFGQLRDEAPGASIPVSATLRKAYDDLPRATLEKVEDMGRLLKWVSEYIIENELIRYRHQPWAVRAVEHIRGHLHEPITLESLAAAVGRSPAFLSRHFRKELGMTPHQYIRKCKLQAARRRLEAGAAVRTVARDLAFYDEYHFSKSFKAFWGKPPIAFRRRR